MVHFIYLANNFIAAKAIQCSGLYQGFQPVPVKRNLFDNVNCDGDESTLQMCQSIRVGSCGTSGYAGVRCEGMCNNFVLLFFTSVIGASLSEPHTSRLALEGDIIYI